MSRNNLFWFDRALRTALGIVMLIMSFAINQTFLSIWGGYLLVTGLVGWCVLQAAVAFGAKAPARSKVAAPKVPGGHPKAA